MRYNNRSILFEEARLFTELEFDLHCSNVIDENASSVSFGSRLRNLIEPNVLDKAELRFNFYLPLDYERIEEALVDCMRSWRWG